MNRGDKRALSTVVSILIIILLVFVAISIVWVVVKSLIDQNSEQISLGKITLNLELEKVTQLQNNSLSVKVKREVGEGSFSGLKLIFEGKKVSEVIKMENISMNEYEVRTLVFNLQKINVSDIETIEIAPIFTLQSGKQVTGDVKDTWVVEQEPIETGLTMQCSLDSQCNDLISCTTDSCASGSCSHIQITLCNSAADGCCPSACNSDNDGDCIDCTQDGQCNDNNLGTTDKCISGTCQNTAITSCTNGDSYCPIGCYSGNDNDCTNACSLDSHCNDNNSSTSDTCVSGACQSNIMTCTGSLTQSCTITNGIGSQSRTCTNGVWSSWGICTVVSCNSGYVISGNSCVASSCSGSSTQSCTITNGVGSQSRTCTDGVWSSWGICTVVSCNSGYVISGNSCVASGNWQTGIVSWWKLDSGASDSEGSNNGVVVGGTSLSSCKSGGCYQFNGVSGGGEYIRVNNAASLDGFSQMTLSAWVNINELPSSSEKTIAGKELSYKLDVNSAGKARFLTGNNWVGSTLVSSGSLTTSNWINIIATYDGSIKKIYINGIQDSATVSTTGSISTNVRNFTIGAYEGSSGYWNNFNGAIDEVIIWNRALSSSEVSDVYNYFG